MNLFHLKYFLKLAELEHYTLAAKELNITQPSLSHAISSLEEDIQVKLFEKKGRNIALTKSGKLFYNIVSVAVNNIDEAVEYVRRVNDGNGLINIGFLRTLGIVSVPTLCRQFKDKNTEKTINFNLYNGSPDELVGGLKSGQYDIILTSKIEHNHNVEYIPFGQHELVLITSKNHELAKTESISLEEITNYDFISFKKNTELNKIITPNFERIKKAPTIKYTAEGEQIIAGLVAQDFGIAIVPDTPILDSLDIARIKINNIDQNRIYYIAYLKDKLNTPLISEFIEFASKQNFSKYIKPY